MSTILVIGNKNYSSWSLRPWLFLRHFEVPFTEVRIPLDEPETASRIRQYSAAGKVPVLLHEGRTIWESLAILEYSNEQLNLPGLPEAPEARARCRSVCAEMHSGFAALRNELPMNCRREFPQFTPTEAAHRDSVRIQQIWQDCRDTFGASGPWLFGAFSMADAMYAPVVSRFQSYGVSVEATGRKYMETVLGHPALQEWVAAAREETEVLEAEEINEGGTN